MEHPVKKLIREGEHQQQDFKYRIDSARKIARSLVAFANTDGGRLLVGVKDNGKIAGIDSDEEYHVVEAAASLYAKPEVAFESHAWVVDGKTVLEVSVPKAAQRPHFAKDDSGNWIAYVRKNDMNLVANRVLQKVWEQRSGPKGAKVRYSETEQLLFSYLRQHPAISFSKFRRLANINNRKAEAILVKLICWDVLQMVVTEKGYHYSLPKNAAPPLLET